MKESNQGLQWYLLDEANEYLIGITQSALDNVGSVLDLDASETDDEFNSGDWIGEIQGKNATVEILAPFALQILEINPDLGEDWQALEDDPTGDAWIFRVSKTK